MKQNHEYELKAAVVFEDKVYADMLKNELILSNFLITDETEADLVLTEGSFLPFITGNKRIILFLDEDEKNKNKDTDIAEAVFSLIFSLPELKKELSRIYSLILLHREIPRKHEKKAENVNTGDSISLLPDRKNALICGEKVAVSPNEWAVLDLLCKAAKKGEFVSREELGAVMGHGLGEGGNIVDVYICRLRKRIEMPSGRRLIYTVRGKGYSLVGGKG